MWAGEASWNTVAPSNAIWQFNTSSSCSGTWTYHGLKNGTSSELMRPAGGAAAVSKDTGYVSPGTDMSVPDVYEDSARHYIPGVASFNMSSGLWANSSTAFLNGWGLGVGGTAQYLAPFGSNGVVVIFGGSQPQSSKDAGGYVNVNNITLYDLSTNMWYAQSTTGTSPNVMHQFCSVAVRSNDIAHNGAHNGSYEM